VKKVYLTRVQNRISVLWRILEDFIVLYVTKMSGLRWVVRCGLRVIESELWARVEFETECGCEASQAVRL